MGAKAWIVAALALAGISAPAATAHHSYAMFDLSKATRVEGTVAKLEWVNPHVFLWAYVPRAQGGHQLYAFETDAVLRLSRLGWSPTSLVSGQKVAVEFAPLRDGRPGGKLNWVQLPDGRILSTTDGPPAAPSKP